MAENAGDVAYKELWSGSLVRSVSLRKISTPLVFLVIWSLAACNLEAQEAKVKVGVIVPLSGMFVRYGEKIQNAISRFSNPKIEFVYEDEGCDARIAVTAYKKLSEIDGVKYFIGPFCGSPQSALAPLLEKKEQIAILGSSAPASVFSMSDKRMFSTQHSIEEESAFLAQEAFKYGAKKVVIVFSENQFSRAHESAFRAHFNGEILETCAYSSDGSSELKAIALRIKKLRPDALYVPDATPLMTGLIRELEVIGISNLPIYSIYSMQSDDVLKVIGNGKERITYSYPDIGGKEALDYFPTLAAKTILDAIGKCGNDATCSKNYMLSRKDFNGVGVLSGQMILKTIRNGEFVPFDG